MNNDEDDAYPVDVAYEVDSNCTYLSGHSQIAFAVTEDLNVLGKFLGIIYRVIIYPQYPWCHDPLFPLWNKSVHYRVSQKEVPPTSWICLD